MPNAAPDTEQSLNLALIEATDRLDRAGQRHNSPRFDRRKGRTGYTPAFAELEAAAIAYANAERDLARFREQVRIADEIVDELIAEGAKL